MFDPDAHMPRINRGMVHLRAGSQLRIACTGCQEQGECEG